MGLLGKVWKTRANLRRTIENEEKRRDENCRTMSKAQRKDSMDTIRKWQRELEILEEKDGDEWA